MSDFEIYPTLDRPSTARLYYNCLCRCNC